MIISAMTVVQSRRLLPTRQYQWGRKFEARRPREGKQRTGVRRKRTTSGVLNIRGEEAGCRGESVGAAEAMLRAAFPFLRAFQRRIDQQRRRFLGRGRTWVRRRDDFTNCSCGSAARTERGAEFRASPVYVSLVAREGRARKVCCKVNLAGGDSMRIRKRQAHLLFSASRCHQ